MNILNSIVSIVLALISLLSTCGWFVAGRKYKQEVASLRADVKQKELNLSTDFAEKFNRLIGGPLETELVYLRTELKRLTHAIQQINNCPLSADCPVRKQLHDESEGDPRGFAKVEG